MYYSTNVGPAHFLMLNSYISYDVNSAQYAFAERDLAAYAAANPRLADGTTTGLTPWLIVGECSAMIGPLLDCLPFAAANTLLDLGELDALLEVSFSLSTG